MCKEMYDVGYKDGANAGYRLAQDEIKKILVKTDIGLDSMGIDLVQSIEKSVDNAMVGNGFTRTTTSKSSNCIEFNYRRFAAAGTSTDNTTL